MTTAFSPNEGDRPSRLLLARYATGELSGEERAQVEAWLAGHPEGRAWLDELEAARPETPPFDPVDLRRRALHAVHEVSAVPQAANRPFPVRWVIGVAVALAVALLLALPALRPSVDPGVRDPGEIRFRGDAGLSLYVLDGPTLAPWSGVALGEGDVVGFRVMPAGHSRVVLVSVDGTGSVTIFYPQAGDRPEPFPAGAADFALPLTVTLDAAEGPEVFVAAFDADPIDVRRAVREAWQAGGKDGVVAWADTHDADVVVVEKR